MYKNLIIITICLFSFNSYCQDDTYKEISYSQLFKLIKQEKDSVFKLSKHLVLFNAETDSIYFNDQSYFLHNTDGTEKKEKKYNTQIDTIYKTLLFNNVAFNDKGVIRNKYFKKPVKFNNCYDGIFENNIFEDYIEVIEIEKIEEPIISYYKSHNSTPSSYFRFYKNTFNSYVNSVIIDKNPNSRIDFDNNIFNFKNISSGLPYFSLNHSAPNSILVFQNNKVYNDINPLAFSIEKNVMGLIVNNQFCGSGFITISGEAVFNIENNDFPNYLNIRYNKDSYYKWEDLLNKFHYIDYTLNTKYNLNKTSNKYEAFERYSYVNKKFYDSYIENLSKLYDNYQSKRNFNSANHVYVAIKDLETKRFKYLYEIDKSFNSYFKWQVNRFIGYFSDYGTEPSKAIVISSYVILIFAFIYFFFPNDWDSNGKNRMMRRYKFFLEYLNIDSGMHEIYIKDQSDKMLEFEEFKSIIDNSEHKVPKFFKATAIPLYRWAISGVKTTSLILSKLDIMKGTWEEVPAKSKWWKGLILIIVFIFAIAFDVLVKLLNALMLSINTFSTLGFGDIPIKGLPRYLAIIEGFIGWFMLTIFSVSLISQLVS